LRLRNAVDSEKNETVGPVRISVVMPSFNQADYLEAALLSVLEQDCPGVELLVYDGGSTDGSVGIIRRYADRVAYWQSGPDGGQAAAIRDGFLRAKGGILCWLNSDDLFEPGALRAVTEAFAKHADVDIVYGDLLYIESDGRPAFPSSVVLRTGILTWASPGLTQPSTFWTRDIYQRAGGVDPSFRYAMDFDLLMRMMQAGARPLQLRRRLARFRLHPLQKTQQLAPVGRAEVEKILARLRSPATPRAVRAVQWLRYRLQRLTIDWRAEWSPVRHRLWLWGLRLPPRK
jgi:glycosyltransferase involved in cell wall biosynthesis